MASTLDAREFPSRLQRLDALLRQLEHQADPAALASFQEILQTVLDLHGAGLDRLLAQVAEAGDASQAVLDFCAEDEVVGGMLLLHGLHPLDLEGRVRQALDGVRPYLRSHGGNVEVLAIRDGVVHLRLRGSCHGCASSAATVKQTIEQAIFGRAPEIVAVEVENVVATVADESGRLALPVL
jgi:Fe-S cluster biogenesis protein NfuA